MSLTKFLLVVITSALTFTYLEMNNQRPSPAPPPKEVFVITPIQQDVAPRRAPITEAPAVIRDAAMAPAPPPAQHKLTTDEAAEIAWMAVTWHNLVKHEEKSQYEIVIREPEPPDPCLLIARVARSSAIIRDTGVPFDWKFSGGLLSKVVAESQLWKLKNPGENYKKFLSACRDGGYPEMDKRLREFTVERFIVEEDRLRAEAKQTASLR